MGGGGLTGEEVAKHNNKESCWVIVHGKACYSYLHDVQVLTISVGLRCHRIHAGYDDYRGLNEVNANLVL
jgi:hypothetical protein